MPKGKGYKYDGATKGHGSTGGAKSTQHVPTPTDTGANRKLGDRAPANHNSGVGRLQAYKKDKRS